MVNLTKFKCTNKDFLDYMNQKMWQIIIDNNLEDKDEVIYISAPMTGIDNYQYRFKQMYDWVKYIYHDCDIFIINPSKYLDEIPEQLNASYVDKIFFCFELLNLATILILDDSTDKWMESRGCLTELMYAQSSGITMYGYDYVVNATKWRHYLDEDYDIKQDYNDLDNKFMEYELIWEADK